MKRIHRFENFIEMTTQCHEFTENIIMKAQKTFYWQYQLGARVYFHLQKLCAPISHFSQLHSASTGGFFSCTFIFKHTEFPLFSFLFFLVLPLKKGQCARYHWHGRINNKYQRKSNKTNLKENGKWNAQRTLLAYSTHCLWFFISPISVCWENSLII